MGPCCLRYTFIYILVCFYSVASTTFIYKGHKVIRLVPKTHSHLKTLRVLRSTNNQLDFWTEPSSLETNVDVRVHPELLEDLTNILLEENIEHSVIIEDVQDLIDKQQDVTSAHHFQKRDETKSLIDFTKYHRLNTIYEYLNELALAYPDIVQVTSIGKTWEGRNVTLVKIGKQSTDCKPSIWIDAGIHAREWIAPATALYLIHQLATNVESQTLVDNIDWYILPVANPDGYEYTHTGDRFWRKTRSLRQSLGNCRGVDANRNFDFHFDDGGSSNNPCSEVYHGPKALSESETKSIAEFLVEHKKSLKLYVSLHAYGQVILTPWGYTYKLPSDYNETYDLTAEAVKALTAVNGTEYKIGPIAHLMYLSSGSSADFAKGAAGVKHALGMELRDDGKHGFLLPASQIRPTGMETLEMFKYFAQSISNSSNACL